MKLRSDSVLAILLLASAGLNLLQLHQAREMRDAASLRAGATLPPISAATVDGVPTTVSVSGDLPTVLYVFSPECGWCVKNRENVLWLESELRGKYRFVGISLTVRGLREHLKENPLPVPVYQSPSPEALAAYRMESTPMTMFISRSGALERAWSGAYAEDVKADIRNYLATTL